MFKPEVMQESGVDLDFDILLNDDDLGLSSLGSSFHEIQSKPISQSQPTEVKNAPLTMRTNLKQHLMKQKFQEEQKRREQQSQAQPAYQIPSIITQQSTKAVQITGSSLPSEVPPAIFKVKTGLLHPTKYHVEKKQKQQVEDYLTQVGSTHATSTQSLPAAIAAANNSLNVMPPGLGSGSSAPIDPESPLSAGLSSTATSVSEIDDIDLLDGIISLEPINNHMDNDLIEAIPQFAHTMPHNVNFLDHLYEQNTPVGYVQKSSSSCPAEISDTESVSYHGGRQRQGEPPPFLTDDEIHNWTKERAKKDSHNVIEKRRRLNINDRIKELGTLLPRSIDSHLYSDMRQNKGMILRASVDYIRKLKRDQDRLRSMEDRQKQMEYTNRRMLLKMQEMEMLMQANGISSPTPSQSTSAKLLVDVLKTSTPNYLKPEPESIVASVPDDIIMDDPSPISNDPMMSQLTPLVTTNQQTSNVSMEEISEMLS